MKNKICLWDLNDKVYIKIKDDVRKEFFKSIRKNVNNKKDISKLIRTNKNRKIKVYYI